MIKEKVFGHTHKKNIILIIRKKLIKKDDWIFWGESFYVCMFKYYWFGLVTMEEYLCVLTLLYRIKMYI